MKKYGLGGKIIVFLIKHLVTKQKEAARFHFGQLLLFRVYVIDFFC